MKINDSSIVLVNSCNKNNFIKKISEDKLLDIKVMTFNELKSKLLFSYDEKAIYEIMIRENVSYVIAKKYIENLYWLDDIDSSKVNKLLNIKKYLMEENLITFNELFKESLKNKNIYVYDIPYLTKEQIKLLDGYNYTFINQELVDKEYTIYEFETLDDEVSFVATEISKLLKQGIDIDRIKLINLTDEYRMIIQKVFKIFKIPTNIRPSINLYSTNLCQIFLKKGFEELEHNVKSLEDEKIANKIIDICNKYVWCHNEELKQEMIIYEIKNTKLNLGEISGISEDNLETSNYDDYLFLLGFNQALL